MKDRVAIIACFGMVAAFLAIHSAAKATGSVRALQTTTQAVGEGPSGDPCASRAALAIMPKDPAAKCRALYAQARCVLVVQCAPYLSRGLISNNEWPTELAPLADKGIKCLDQIIESIGEAKKNADEDLALLESHTELLLAFGSLFAALGKDPKNQTTREALIEACGGLSPWLDDSDSGLVESARLWQAVAYRRAGRADRALQLLRPALAPPINPRIGLWCRIERCRALGDRGEFAAGISLAQQLASRSASWLSDEKPETRTQASESIDQARIDLYESWGRRLRADGKTTLADNAAEQAEQLRKKVKLTDQLVLTDSIAGIPDPDSESPSDEDDEP